ncbi:MFS transporter [Streptacidiphilus fuscans]|uniref:MFS transporter n=1 Tax=Streptacidiphilus fuscans TaxID=2789292 RepID=A0A931AZQ8_9ACTN|nr:MFS transporter [Streptacidiphilus fuscans]MBF9067691.1 MFS transporter [Streptacidiphilus fuscans]
MTDDHAPGGAVGSTALGKAVDLSGPTEAAEQPQSADGSGGLIRKLRVFAVYVGAALGPLGGGVVAPMLPQMSKSLNASMSSTTLLVTAYFVPFALVQLVSGTAGERWGRRRTVLGAYVVYLVASLLGALAPNIGLLLVVRAVMGTANAFISPLLLSGLADMVSPRRLSRSVGLLASCQAAGQSLSPLLGGVAAAVNWRWAFVGVAVAAGVLALAPPPGGARPGAQAPRLRPLVNGRMGLLAVAAFVSYFGAAGLPFLVSLHAEEHLGVRPDLTGVALLGFGLTGLLLGTSWGALSDRFGGRVVGGIGAALGAVLVALTGSTHSLLTLVLCWTGAGVCYSMLNVALQNLTVREVPSNRGGALSAVSAFRFGGAAVAPIVLLPLYNAMPSVSFVVGGGSLLLATVSLAALRAPRTGVRS